MYDIHKPTVVFVEIRESVLGRTNHVHKVDFSRTVVHDTVDIDCEEHNNKQELQAVYVIACIEFNFFGREKVQRKRGDSRVIDEVLQRDNPRTVS